MAAWLRAGARRRRLKRVELPGPYIELAGRGISLSARGSCSSSSLPRATTSLARSRQGLVAVTAGGRSAGVINVTGQKPENDVSSQTSRPLDALLQNSAPVSAGAFLTCGRARRQAPNSLLIADAPREGPLGQPGGPFTGTRDHDAQKDPAPAPLHAHASRRADAALLGRDV
jgi:hypothetical protein